MMTCGKKFYGQWNTDNSLFAIYMGSNDIADIGYKENAKSIIDDELDSYLDTVINFYNDGARNFMFLYLPPLDKGPVNTKGKHNYFKENIPYFNQKLMEKAQLLYGSLDDINIFIYNTYEEYNYVLENYEPYNFISNIDSWKKERKDRMNKYFWRDNTHISNKANLILAMDINDYLNSFMDYFVFSNMDFIKLPEIVEKVKPTPICSINNVTIVDTNDEVSKINIEENDEKNEENETTQIAGTYIESSTTNNLMNNNNTVNIENTVTVNGIDINKISEKMYNSFLNVNRTRIDPIFSGVQYRLIFKKYYLLFVVVVAINLLI